MLILFQENIVFFCFFRYKPSINPKAWTREICLMTSINKKKRLIVTLYFLIFFLLPLNKQSEQQMNSESICMSYLNITESILANEQPFHYFLSLRFLLSMHFPSYFCLCKCVDRYFSQKLVSLSTSGIILVGL